jgi:hypothetical protein
VINGPLLSSSLTYTHKEWTVGAEVAFNSHLDEKSSKPEVSVINLG